ncbi:hypothetical protein PG988_007940 [Apiospora saccharicola]
MEISEHDDLWKKAPQAFWRFAEHHVPNQKTTPDLVDTGVTLRAVIPWPDESSRLGLRSYAGEAPTWDARVVCFGPLLENMTFVASSASMNTQGSLGYNGTSTVINQTRPGHVFSPINCTTDWISTISLCLVVDKFTLDPWLPQGLGLDTKHSQPLDLTESSNYLVLRTSHNLEDVDPGIIPFNIAFANDQNDADWSIRRDGPWTAAFNSSGYQMFALSYCCTTPAIYYANVTMNGTSGDSEHTIELQPYETSIRDSIVADRDQVRPLRRQLGATMDNLTLLDRGILSLGVPKPARYNLAPIEGPISRLVPPEENSHHAFPFAGYTNTAFEVHQLHGALFEDIMYDTGNPALALQAFSTTLNQMAYYESRYRWSANNSITYVMSKSMSIPIGRAGFISVIVIAAAHLGILVVTSVLFVQRTKATLIGNPWQSIAQVVSDDTLPILARADGPEETKDKEMPNVTGVIQRRQNGRIEFGEKQE